MKLHLRSAMHSSTVAIAPKAIVPPRFERKNICITCSRSSHSGSPSASDSECDILVSVGVRALVTFTVVSLTSLTIPGTAQARYVWKPRRHLRRMGEDRSGRLREHVKEVEAREEARLLRRLGYSSENTAEVAEPNIWSAGTNKLTNLFGGNQGYTVKLAPDARQSQPTVHISSRQRAIRVNEGPQLPALSTAATWVLMAGLVTAVVVSLSRLLGWRWQWGRAPEKGRWVSDRSLGGKLVFIPEGSTRSSSSSPALVSWDTDKTLDTVKDPEVSSAVLRAGREDDSPPVQSTAPPSWWSPPAPSSLTLSASSQEQAKKEARSLLAGMEEAKLLRGTDYSLPALVELRRTCQEANISVKPKSDNIRDAMFRTAVSYATDTARDASGSLLGNCTPPEFVCGLAKDLGVPDSKAIIIVNADVASKCRSILINALAAHVSEDCARLFQELLGLASLLDAFPLSPGSAEASLVGPALEQRASLQCRKEVFFTLGAMTRERAAIVAEMLGFNPELVMPELEKKLQGFEEELQTKIQ